MYKRLFLFLIAGLLLAACHSDKSNDNANGDGPYESIDTVPMLIMQVQKCSRLYTTEYQVHKIVTHSDLVRLKGSLFNHNFNIALPFGDRKIAIPMDATLKAYIDFSQFSSDNVRREGKRIIVTLPDPKVMLTSSKIDHDNVREYVSLTRSNFSDAELSLYEMQGRQAILKAIPQMGILERARESAANVIIPLITQLGFAEQDIIVTFRNDINTTDISKLLDLSNLGQ